MGVVISCQQTKINKLETETQVAKEKARLMENNEKILKEEIVRWKTKDSTSVVTVGILSADKDMFKTQLAEIDRKFNNLINDNNKKTVRLTYLETQLTLKDSVIAKLNRSKPGGPSYIQDDSTIVINDTMRVDDRNYRKTTGTIKIGIDSNRINTAEVNLSTSQAIGVDLALYKDRNGIDRVSVGTKYPNAHLNVVGINDIEQHMKDYKDLAAAQNKKKGRVGIGLTVGYGFLIKGNYIYRGPYAGVGLQYNLIRLK